MWSKSSVCLAAAIAYASIGCPKNGAMFLRGMRLEPPRAGMTAIIDLLGAPSSWTQLSGADTMSVGRVNEIVQANETNLEQAFLRVIGFQPQPVVGGMS